ncbi:MAG: hypothetical protein LBU76_03065 [Azoarcus sp.]|jgi:hypothetical protein|nr:hypothetical protein [Azoarcus sp.]
MLRDIPDGVPLFFAKTTGMNPTVTIPEQKHPKNHVKKDKIFNGIFVA